MPDHCREEELVAAAQAGDLHAFDDLAFLLRPELLRRAAAELNDGSFAEDLVQESLLMAYKNLDQLEEPSLLRPWMMAILRRRAWRWNREERPQPLDLNDLDLLLIRQSRELARGRDEAVQAQAVLGTLSQDDQMILRMAAIDGLSTREMSGQTGLNESTVKWRLHEARRRARTALEENHEQ